MKIGLFGDSYVDTIWHRNPGYNPPEHDIVWTGDLLRELESPVVTSGIGGTNQFYAINKWQKYSATTTFDYAIFTFTWDHRLYSNWANRQNVLSSVAELRELNEYEQLQQLNMPANEVDDINLATSLYYQYLHNDHQSQFVFELMVKWCLDLPKQYPDTKFIFIPNTELSRTMSQKYFTNGVLLDFAFETLSNRETGSPGPMPIQCGRYGHINRRNHIVFKDMMKDIILNYRQYQNQLYTVDYNKFDIVK